MGSDNSVKMRQRYDDEYLNELEEGYIKIDDNTTLPSRQQINAMDRSYQYQACVMFFDTLLERQIDLGSRYKFNPMTQGECLINEQMAESLNVE